MRKRIGWWIARNLLRLVYPLIRSWLWERALHLPRATRTQIAERFGVSERVVDAVYYALHLRFYRAIDRKVVTMLESGEDADEDHRD